MLNSVVVPRPSPGSAAARPTGVLNLAPHSFYTVACVDPPVVQFTSVGRKDSLSNVEATGEFTVSLTPEALFEQINATATDFPAARSEAEHCGVRLEPSERVGGRGWPTPPSRSSACCTRTLRLGDSTVAFGRVRHISAWESAVRDGRPRIEHLRPLARLGGNEWSTIGEVKEIPPDPLRWNRDRSDPGGNRREWLLPAAGRPGPPRLPRRPAGAATSSAASAPNASANRSRKLSVGRSYSWVPTTSTAAVATAEPSWVARSRPSPHIRPAMNPARSASPPPVGSTGLVSGTAMTEIGSSSACRTSDALGGPGGHPGADPGEHLVVVPAGLLLQQVRLVLVGEQHVGAVDQAADHLAVGPGELLAGVGGEGVAALPALLGVPHHRGRVVGADDHQIGAADPVGDRRSSMSPASDIAPE